MTAQVPDLPTKGIAVPADFSDRRDFENSEKGFIATLEPLVVKGADGRIVWDMDWGFLEEDCPDTANPSLWRQAQLTAIHGLYEVTDGIYQVRGFDMSNMTLVEGSEGVIVIDPLISVECAAAALALYRANRGERPVTAVIYTHAHIDHFGGVLGVVEADTSVPIIAPKHFLEHAVSENVYAGNAMIRRSYYYSAMNSPKGPAGNLGIGLGAGGSSGTVSLLAPTLDITHTGQEEVIDGVRIVFQMTPGTECPAEMNFYFPDKRALCMAENATHNMHNILTLRGAQVRDPRIWSRYLAEAVELFAEKSDVSFASHHWPTWGTDAIVEYLTAQRDLYAYLHDQTLRLLNEGFVGSEIAETLELPPTLESSWHTHGYYGSVSHNVKAIYQRYLGWYDGNPAHLWPHPPVEAAQRYVAAMGGADAAVALARQAYDEGDYRWGVEVLNHVLFADESHAAARALQADALEQLGFGAENGTWRSAFLAGATELRYGNFGTPASSAPPDLVGALTVEQVLGTIAVRIDGPRAWDEHLVLSFVVTDVGAIYIAELRNGTLNSRVAETPAAGSTTFTLTRPALIGLVTGTLDLAGAVADATVAIDGDAADLQRLVGLLAPVNPDFPIVTP